MSRRASGVHPGAPLSTRPFPRSLEPSSPVPSGPSRGPGHLSHIFPNGETPCQSPVPVQSTQPPVRTHTRVHRVPGCLCVTSIPPQHPIPVHTQKCLARSTALGTGPSPRSQPSGLWMPTDPSRAERACTHARTPPLVQWPLSRLCRHVSHGGRQCAPRAHCLDCVQRTSERTMGSPARGAGGSVHVVCYTRKTGTLGSS